MRVLVTGGAGFIGSHIVDELRSRGHEPFVVDNLSSGRRENLPCDVPLFEIDIRDAAALSRLFGDVRPEAVCHQAAQMSVSRSVAEPAYDAEVNVVGWLKVLEAAARVEVRRIVFASSGGVLYGDVEEPVAEDYAAAPISPYGIAKWVGERYLHFFARRVGLTGVALRYSNVYGPRQNPHGEAGVVAIFCRRMLAGERVCINGDGSYVRDYVFGSDVAHANVLALEAVGLAPFVPLNIGTGEGTDVNELAARLQTRCAATLAALGRRVDVLVPEHGPPRPGDLRSSLVAAARAEKLLGWRPSVPLDEGLRRTVEWFARDTK